MMNGSGINDKLISFGHVNAFAPVFFLVRLALRNPIPLRLQGKSGRR